ncbi:MAG: chemotaxis protein CheX [Planctomycetes bacterium]|nr:chemotaxis protein CheX [Planctomycetota bacterium]
MTEGPIDYFIKSTTATFQHQLHTNVSHGSAEQTAPKVTDKDITAIVGFGGMANGSLVIGLDKEPASKLLSRLVQMEMDFTREQIIDGVGELANIIAGSGIAAFWADTPKVNISVPTILLESGVEIAQVHTGPIYKVPFSCDITDFDIFVSLVAVVPVEAVERA